MVEEDQVGFDEAATPAISSTLPVPIRVAGSGLARRCINSATTCAARARHQLAKFGERFFGVKAGECRERCEPRG